MSQVLSGSLAARIRSATGVNPYLCYQCKRCTAGCPVAQFADVHPAQVMRAVQLGDESRSVDSRFIWLCTGCQTCTTRCPQGIDVAAVMDGLRIVARQDDRVRDDMPFSRLLRLNYGSFKRWGRLFELELVSRDMLRRPKAALGYIRLGPKMLAKGKMGWLPSSGDRRQMKRMVRAAERIEAERAARAKAASEGKAPGATGSGKQAER